MKLKFKKPRLMIGMMTGLSMSVVLLGSVHAISATGWTVSGQNTYFDGTGYVGIGTSAPSKIELWGPIRTRMSSNGAASIVLQPSNGTSQTFGMTAMDENGLYLGRTTAPNAGFANPDFYMDGSGKIGINTIPQTRLDVKGDGVFRNTSDGLPNLYLQPQDGSGTTFGLEVTKTGGSNAPGMFIGRTINSNIGTPVYPDFYFNTNGYIGVNTYAPTERFQVQGNIKVNGNIVSDGNICIGKCS